MHHRSFNQRDQFLRAVRTFHFSGKRQRIFQPLHRGFCIFSSIQHKNGQLSSCLYHIFLRLQIQPPYIHSIPDQAGDIRTIGGNGILILDPECIFFMYGKSQKTDCFFSNRYLFCIQRHRQADLFCFIHSRTKSYQSFDIELSGMDQADRKIFNFPLQTHFIPIYDILQVQGFLKWKFCSKTADDPSFFPHIKDIYLQISRKNTFPVSKTDIIHNDPALILDQSSCIRFCIRYIKILIKSELTFCPAFFL